MRFATKRISRRGIAKNVLHHFRHRFDNRWIHRGRSSIIQINIIHVYSSLILHQI